MFSDEQDLKFSVNFPHETILRKIEWNDVSYWASVYQNNTFSFEVSTVVVYICRMSSCLFTCICGVMNSQNSLNPQSV